MTRVLEGFYGGKQLCGPWARRARGRDEQGEISSSTTEEVTAELDLEGKATIYPVGKKTGNGQEVEAWRSESKEHRVGSGGTKSVETLPWL